MLDRIACLLAPQLPDLTAGPAPALPNPCREPDLTDRARAAFEALDQIAFEAGGRETNPYKLLLGLGCRDVLTREADQVPGRAGMAPNYERFDGYATLGIPLGDGVTMRGHHSQGPPGAPIVIIVHGLFDSHVSGYVVELAEVLRRFGFHVVALDLRDHGLSRGVPPPPCLGLEEGRDLLKAARALSRGEGVSVGMLGLSYGGHCVVRAAFEASRTGHADLLRGGVMAVGAPLDVAEGVRAFDDGSRLPRPGSLFERVMFWGVQREVNRQLKVRMKEHGLSAARRSVYEQYIRQVIMPAYPDGPGDLDALLLEASCARPEVMAELAVPTALVHPVDDPLVPVEHMRKALAAAGGNPLVHGLELPLGGHVGLSAADPRSTMELLAAFFGRLRDG
jgi:predicted alpha/beta-fold hydrolase